MIIFNILLFLIFSLYNNFYYNNSLIVIIFLMMEVLQKKLPLKLFYYISVRFISSLNEKFNFCALYKMLSN